MSNRARTCGLVPQSRPPRGELWRPFCAVPSRPILTLLPDVSPSPGLTLRAERRTLRAGHPNTVNVLCLVLPSSTLSAMSPVCRVAVPARRRTMSQTRVLTRLQKQQAMVLTRLRKQQAIVLTRLQKQQAMFLIVRATKIMEIFTLRDLLLRSKVGKVTLPARTKIKLCPSFQD